MTDDPLTARGGRGEQGMNTSTRVYAPLGMLGYGFPESSLEAAVAEAPDVFVMDGGSIDPGPYYLGSGASFTNPVMVHRDLSLLLPRALDLDVPLIIGSAGGSGARPHLDRTLELIRRIADEQGLRFRMAIIPSDLSADQVKDAIRRGMVSDFEVGRELTEDDVDACPHIVAQMGAEPFIEALRAGAQVIVAGRAYDAAGPAALPLLRGADPGLAFHMGKIVECGAQVALPRASDGVIADVHADRFEIGPADPEKRCTVPLVAGHTLYEKSDPYLHGMPGGSLDLHAATYEQLDARRVAIRGSVLRPAPVTTVKLEGSAFVGHRSVCIAGVRDPILIEHLDEMLESVRRKLAVELGSRIPPDSYRLGFRVYGRSGVMGELEPELRREDREPPYEVAVLIDAVAPTQAEADTVVALARSASLHMGYPGRKATAGNVAFPYSPAEFPAPPSYEFRIYHLMTVEQDPTEMFPITWEDVDGTR